MPETLDSLQIEISANANSASKQIDKLVTSLNSLKNSVSGISGLSQIASDLKEIGSIKVTGLTGLAKQINQLGSMDTSKIGQMKTALREFGSSVNQLNGISVSPQISQMSELARSISRFGNASAGTAITNMPKLADGLKQMMGTLSKAPKVSQNLIDMTKALADFSRTGSSGVKAANSLGTSIKNMTAKTLSAPKALKSLNASLKSTVSQIKQVKNGILSALGVVGGITAIISGIKKSIDVRSDVTEAQNVIDVTFGRYKDLVEDMAKTSIRDFGISELAVKNTAGRYQAMGTAAGIARKEMAKMSVTLTGLSADMASFYNQSQEDVAKSLQSVFTGETEPLRKYGIDLTQATLKEWAMKQGLDANIQSMSQAEKIMLRYNYVLENSAAAQKDFSRTSGSWANQIKILKEQLTQLASVLGTAFINALKPLVTALNKALASIIEFAAKVVNALGKIFGWKATVSNAGIADDFSEAASGAEDVSGSMGSAAGSSKKLKDNLSKAVRSFDELKTISLQTDSSGSGGSGGSGSGASGGGGIKNEDAFKIVETENPFKSSIKDLEGLGKSIRNALMNAMDGIKWEDVYAKAKGFGKGLAQFLNGLFAADKNGNTVFGSLGKTIAGALNSLIYSVFSFSEEFKWKNFGSALRQGIQSFINTADLATAGYTVGNLVKGIATSVYEMLKDPQTWKDLGKKIADGINGFLKSMNETDQSTGKNGWQITADMFNSLVDALIETIRGVVSGITWEDITSGIKDFLGELELDTVAVAIGAFALKYNGIKLAANNLVAILSKSLNSLAALAGLTTGGLVLTIAITAVVSGIIWEFATHARGWVDSFKEWFNEKSTGSKSTGYDANGNEIEIHYSWKATIDNLKFNFGKNVSFEKIFNWEESSRLFNEAFQKIKDSFSEGLAKLDFGAFGANIIEGIGLGIIGAISLIVAPIKNFFTGVGTAIADTFGIHSPATTMKPYGKNILLGIVEGFTGEVSEFTKAISDWWKNHVEPWFTLKKWSDLAKNVKNGIVSGFKNMVDSWKKSISSWWNSNVSPWFKKEKWSNIAKGIKDGISKKWGEFKNWWDNTAVVKWFDDFKNNFSAENIKSKVGSIKSAFKEKWDDFKIWWDDTAVANWISKFEKKFSLDSLKSKIGSIKAAFKAKWDVFTSWWKNIKLSFPKIKMPHFKIEFDTTNILGKDFKYPKGFNVEYYAAGGFPTQGSLFWAGEGGVPEILGNVGGKTAVAGGAEITGIKDAINDTSKEEIALLRQQNQLLQALLQKDYGITKAEIGKAARDYARDQYYKTGESVFVF